MRSILCNTTLLLVLLVPLGAGAQAPEHIWSDSFGGLGLDLGEAVAMDAAGNVYITGYCYGDIDFGGGTITNAGGSDIFLAKFDEWGNHRWSYLFGDAGDQVGKTITVDPSGDLIVAGRFQGTVNFGGSNLTSAGSDDIWVAKFQPDGTHLWGRRFGDSDQQFAWSVTTDANGDVFLFGQFQGTVDFGGGPLVATAYDDIYIAKLRGSDSAHLWSKLCYGQGYDWATDIAVDASGSVFVTGFFDSTITFGGPTLTSSGAQDIYIAKLGAGGAEVWSNRFGDTQGQIGVGIAVDYQGDVVAVGEFYGTINLGGGNMTSGGQYDFYIAKFDTDGSHIWSNQYGGADNQRIGGLDVHVEGNIVVSGYFENTLDFGGGALNSVGSHDIFVAGLDPSGSHQWSGSFGDASQQYCEGVAVDPSGGVAITGVILGSVEFASGYTLTSNGASDVFIAKFGNPPVGTCAGALNELTPDAPLYSSGSAYEERGMFISPLQDFEVCAIGIKMYPLLPVPFVARIYEAIGTTRGPLLAWGGFVAAGSLDAFQYAPLDFVLDACKDYDISIEYDEPYELWLHDENDFSLPYDVGGVIRVRDGELWGNAADGYLPQLSIIGMPLGCPEYVDIGPPGAPWAWFLGGVEENGVFVTAKNTIKVCGLTWEAEVANPPATVIARIYEANGNTRGPLIGSGALYVTETGIAMYHIPISAVLLEGGDYDFVVEFPAVARRGVDESQITIPYDVEHVITVRSAENGGNPAYTFVNHFGIQWSPYVAGVPFDLGKYAEGYPPPVSTTLSNTNYGVFLTSTVDQNIYSLGWEGDIQQGEIMRAYVFEATGTTRGAMVSEGTIYCENEGMRWHDIPVAAEFQNGADYNVEFGFGQVNESRFWEDYTGMPYSPYGLFDIFASSQGGTINQHKIPHLRVNGCNAAGTAVGEEPARPPRFTLGAPRPNPATAKTTIPFSLDEGGTVTIEVYDVAGRRVSVLLAGESRPEGPGEVELEANKLAAGVYFVKMKNRLKSISRKITIVH